MSELTNFLTEENKKQADNKAAIENIKMEFEVAVKSLYLEMENWLSEPIEKKLISTNKTNFNRLPELTIKTTKGQIVFVPSDQLYLGSKGHVEIKCIKPFVLTLKNDGWKLFEDQMFRKNAPEYIDWNEAALIKVLQEGIR